MSDADRAAPRAAPAGGVGRRRARRAARRRSPRRSPARFLSTGPDADPDAERARHVDAPPRARGPVPRLQQRAAATRPTLDPRLRELMILRVAWRTRCRLRVGAARAHRDRASASPPRRSTPIARRRRRGRVDAARGRPARRDRPAHRRLPHRRRHLGPPRRAARRAAARGARVRRRHLHRPRDGVQQLRARSSTPTCRRRRAPPRSEIEE